MTATTTAFMDGWTVQEWRLIPDDYLRISMKEPVSVYISLHTDKTGRWYVDYYFYGDDHAERASDFLMRNDDPARVERYRGVIHEARPSATVVRLFHFYNPMTRPYK